MPAISLERSNPVQTALVALATVAALALLGLVLAYWTWEWFAPRAEARVPATQTQAEGAPVGLARDTYALFGGARRDGTGAAPAAGTITLLGIVAASGNRPGYAVLRMDGRQTIAVTQGADVEPGLRLAEIRVDHVVLVRNGGRESLAWPQKAGK